MLTSQTDVYLKCKSDEFSRKAQNSSLSGDLWQDRTADLLVVTQVLSQLSLTNHFFMTENPNHPEACRDGEEYPASVII